MHFIVKVDHFTAAVKWVSRLNERVDHGTHTIIVFAEDRLEYGEVKVSHLEHNLVKYIQIGGSFWVLVDVKKGRLKTLHDHIISIDNLLWKNHKQLVDFLIICEPQVFKFKKFTGEQVLLI